MRIGRKLVFSYTALAVVTFLFLSLLLRDSIGDFYKKSMVSRLVADAHSIEVAIGDSSDPVIRSKKVQNLIRNLSGSMEARITLIARDGVVLADSQANPATMENHRDRPEVQSALEGKEGFSERFSTTLGKPMMYVAIPHRQVGSSLSVVRMAIPISDIQYALNQMNILLILIAIGATLLVVIASNFLAHSITLPLKRMTSMAERMSNNDLEQELPVTGHDEISELSRTLNNLAAQLRDRIDELNAEQAKRELILNNMNEGILLLDDQGKIILINPAFEQIFSIRDKKIPGTHISDVLSCYDFYQAELEAICSGKEIVDEIELSDPYRNIQVITLPIFDGPGTRQAIAVVRDITREKQVQRARKDFIANVSHELKTPLTGIKLLTETLRSSIDKDPAASKMFVERLDKELTTTINMVRELIDLSMIEQSQSQTNFDYVNIGALALEVGLSFSEIARTKGLNLNMKIPDYVPSIFGDNNQILTLIRNLVDNAIRYTSAQGTVTIQVEKKGEFVDFSVIDTGIGIAQREIPRVFERFYRVDKARSRETGGTGLGLAIVKHIAENHNARINVISEPGAGSTFTISFPLQ